MNEELLAHFQRASLLSVENFDYQRILDGLFLFLVRSDHVEEDSTVRTFLAEGIQSEVKTGVISTKSSCIIAGVEEVVYLAKKHTKLTPHALVRDGVNVTEGTQVVSFEGLAKEILTYERAFLNILQRMSGIATETGKYVEKIHDLRLKNPPVIAATRKTPWMHLDKKAVAVGGGVTHRLDLRDGILLKDNHLELIRKKLSLRTEGEAISYAIKHSNIADEKIAIEVEVKTDRAAYASVAAWKKRNLPNRFIILLDNYSPERVKKVIEHIRKSESDILFEASGGITIDNVADFSKTGVDVISVGSLTHSPKASDFSLDIE